MLQLTRSEMEADIAEFSAIVNQDSIPEECLGCGARGHRNPNGSGSIAHNMIRCGQRERYLLQSRLDDIAFLNAAKLYAKFEE